MPNLKKPVQFDHFRPYYLARDAHGQSQEHVYDLKSLLQHVKDHPFSETRKTILGDLHMFHICRYDSTLHVWEIQILRLREKMLPGIADDSGTYELIRLEDNQYPAESTTLLYDEDHCTLYMQRNIYGTSIRALEEYLQLISPEGTLVLLKPIQVGSRISGITSSKVYRKFILVADTDLLTDEMEAKPLGQIISCFRKYQGRIVKFEFGFGRQRQGFLNAAEVSSLVHEAYNYSGTQSLSVRAAEDEDTQVETINLMDDRASYKLIVEYSRTNPITHERLYRMCLGTFREEHNL